MTYTIHKGKHRAWPPAFGIYLDKKIMERVVEFDISAKYDHPGTYDDEDVNKLFGFAYIDGGNHQDSARFGWNWNKEAGKVNLYSYCYVNGQRSFIKLCEVITYWKFLLQIQKIGNVYSFTVCDAKNDYIIYGGRDVPFTHKKRWSYHQGCFFGGQLTAPHDIKIKISRK